MSSILLTATWLAGCGTSDEERLARAEAAFAEGDYRAAIVDIKTYLQSQPDSARGRELLGRSSIEIGDAASAEVELNRAVELGVSRESVAIDLGRSWVKLGEFERVLDTYTLDTFPEDQHADVLRLRGDAYVGLDQLEAAREAYQQALALNPSDTSALLGIAHVYYSEGNIIQARENLDQVLGNYPDVVPAWIQSGAMSLSIGDPARALSDFQQAEQRAKAAGERILLVSALYGLAESHLALKQAESVGPILERLVGIAPQDPRTALVDAKMAILEERWNDAQRSLQSVLRFNSESADAQRLLGFVHKQKGNLGQAEMYLNSAMVSQPGNAETRRMLAEVRLQLNKFDLAGETLAPLANSGDSRDLSMIATTTSQLGDSALAVSILRRAIDENPADDSLVLQLAYEYLRSGQTELALETIEGLPESMADRPGFQRDLLQTLASLDPDDAAQGIEQARRLTESWPDESRAHSLLGSMYAMQGQLDLARQSFERSAEVAPEDSEPLFFLAQIDESEERFPDARARYERILELEPENARVLLSMARLAIRDNLTQDAIDWLEKTRAADPDSVVARTALARLYLSQNALDRAGTVAREGLELDPANSELHNVLGLVALQNQRFTEAEERFETGIELNESPEYRLNLARAQAAQQNFSAAIDLLEQNRAETLAHLPSGVFLAALKHRSGNGEGARSVALDMERAHPESAIPHSLRGELLARDGEHAQAAAAFDTALQKEPQTRYAVQAFVMRREAGMPDRTAPLISYLEERPLDAKVRLFLADDQLGQGDLGDAVGNYRQVLQVEPNNYVALNNLAWAYFRSGDGQAVPTARAAYRQMPANASVMDTLGWLLFKTGEHEEGVDMLRRAAGTMGATAQVRYHLAAALAETGEPGEARQILEELITQDAEFSSRSEAEALLARL